MANLFVLYLPVEDVEEDDISEDSNRNESLKNDKKLLTNQQIRQVVSTPDITKMFSPFKETEPKNTFPEQNEENFEPSSENHPLLGQGERGRFVKSQSNTSINKVLKEKKSSEVSSHLKPSVTSTNENPYKKVSGSRFEISEVFVDTQNGDIAEKEGVGEEGSKDGEEGEMTRETMTLKEFLEDKLTEKMKIENFIWQKTNDEAHWMVTFMVSKDRCDYIYNFLTSCGIGWIPETSISIFPTTMHKEGVVGDQNTDLSTKSKLVMEKTEFIKSIKSSLTVAQVVGDISNNAKLTFDFFLLICLASMIAGFGLAENSSVVLVASMLISPLMGPIIGFTFGMVVQNWDLCKLSFRTEIIGLAICLIYGFIFGLFTAGIEATHFNYSVDGVWPTSEMTSRGMMRSLWVGVLIALPSGAGVALAILGGNTGSLVGVAISASLLPPVVNAGMFWGLAVITAIHVPPLESLNSTLNSTLPPLHCTPFIENAYSPTYSCVMWKESLVMGCLSLLLAILNILCIFIMGTLVMKIKEISPLPGATKQSASFWKKDLDFYRNAYETIKGDKSTDMGNMAKTLSRLIKANPKADFRDVMTTVKNDNFFKAISDPNLFNSLLELKDTGAQRTPVQFHLNSQHYHTIGGQITGTDQVPLSSVFQGNGDGSESMANQQPPSPLTALPPSSKTVATPLHAGGCVLRLRRSQSRVTASRHTAHVVTAQKKKEDQDGEVCRVRFEPTVDEEEKEEEEDEMLVMDLDFLKSHTRKSRFQKRKTTGL